MPAVNRCLGRQGGREYPWGSLDMQVGREHPWGSLGGVRGHGHDLGFYKERNRALWGCHVVSGLYP